MRATACSGRPHNSSRARLRTLNHGGFLVFVQSDMILVGLLYWSSRLFEEFCRGGRPAIGSLTSA
jgi:hypothetical protein